MQSRDGASGESSPCPAERPAAVCDEAELVFSLCHEIGNLVGAVRLQAHFLDEDLGARELALASVELDDLGARCTALLAHVRPLLSSGDRVGVRVPAAAILGPISRLIEEHGGRGVRFCVESEPELPELELDPEVVRQLLVSFVLAAAEAAAPRGRVRVCAARRPGAVAFVVEDDGAVREDPRRWSEQMRRGRPLLCAVASCILSKRGGRLEVDRDAGWTRFACVLPAAEASTRSTG